MNAGRTRTRRPQIDAGDAFRVEADLAPPEYSEGPSGGAARLLGGDREGILGHELVDVPRRRTRAGSAVLVGEAAVGHGRYPAALGEHLGEALQQRVVVDTDGPPLERHVVAVDGDAEGAARVALDVPDLARPRTAAEVVAAVDPEGADGGHVGPTVSIGRRQPEGVVA